MKLKDLSGETFGMLHVVQRAEDHYYPSGRHDVQYLCKCDCGNTINVLGIHLRSGHTVSCGCLRAKTARETMTTHGQTGTRLHNIWKNMLERCTNPNHKNYLIYGGRGINVCDEWSSSFEVFFEWAVNNGYDDTLSLDRANVDMGYNPRNCRWITQKEQCNNTRRNINVEIDGETHTLKQWVEILGLNYGTIVSRVKRGWDPVDALKTPVRAIAEHN